MTSASNRSSFVVFAPSMFYWPGPQRYLHSFPTRRSSDLLIRDADAALNRAKKEGPGKRVRFDESLRSEAIDRKSTRLNSSHSQISYAVFCLKKKTNDELAVASTYALLALSFTLILVALRR